MQLIHTNISSSPPLLLGLQLLAGLTDPITDLPLNIVHGQTNVINTNSLIKYFGSANGNTGNSGGNTVALVTLLGQLLWRYAPALFEDIPLLDGPLQNTPSINAYMKARNLPRDLSARRDFRALRSLFGKGGSFGLNNMLRLRRRAAQQDAHYGTRRRRVTLEVPDATMLSDYTVVNQGERGIITENSFIAPPWREIRMDEGTNAEFRFSRKLGDIAHVTGIKSGNRGHAIVGHVEPILRCTTALDMSTLSTLDYLTESAPFRQLDSRCDHNIFEAADELPTGTFYKSPTMVASLEPLNQDLFGYVDVDETPFNIVLNSEVVYPRAQITLAHEILHVMDEMHKWNLSHEMIHELAITMTREILPALSKLAVYTKRSLQ